MRSGIARAVAVFGAAIVAVGAVLLGIETGNGIESPNTAASVSSAATAAPVGAPEAGVPEHAYRTLAEIDAGRWPDSADAPGTKGGDRFRNREGQLPGTDDAGSRVTYREWDVNPKQRDSSRDAERIVTGSDGSAWYTEDHYETFTRMR